MGLLGSGNSLAWLQASPNHSPSFHFPSTKARSTRGTLCAVLVTAVHRGVRAGQDRELGFLSLPTGQEGLRIQLLYCLPHRPARGG